MSFTSDVKKELCRQRIPSKNGQRALLTGFVSVNASLGLRAGAPKRLLSRSTSEQTLLTVGKIAAGLYPLEMTVARVEEEHAAGRPLYELALSGTGLDTLLSGTGFLTDQLPPSLVEALLGNPQERACFLRGCFLGSGSCSHPGKGYRLEILCKTEAFAEDLLTLLNTFQIQGKHTLRKGRVILYLGGEDVSAFLALAGASLAALSVEDTRTEREYRNYLNRTGNCEIANIGKTVSAALLQLQAIEAIEERMPLTELPDSLYEAARLRLSHPEATLQELADLAEIGKSGMNHRLQRLINIAKEYCP